MRIDSHAHGAATRLAGSPKQYIATCRKQGIDGVVLIMAPDEVFASHRKMGSFVIPVPIIEMDRTGVGEIHRLFDQGARGIKFFIPQHSSRCSASRPPEAAPFDNPPGPAMVWVLSASVLKAKGD